MLPQRKKNPVPAPVPEGACVRRCPDHRTFFCHRTHHGVCLGMCRRRRAAGWESCAKCAVPEGGRPPKPAAKRFPARHTAEQEEYHDA